MKARGSRHCWTGTIARLGLKCDYVKRFVKRQKNDAGRLGFVAVKSEEQQAAAVVFRDRDRLARQRT